MPPSVSGSCPPRSLRSFLIPVLCLSLVPVLCLPLVRISAAGTWEDHYSWDYNEQGNSILQTPDSGFVITGTTSSFGPGAPDRNNPFLMKLDPLGNVLWFQTYGSPLDEFSRSVALTQPDGGFILCGSRVSADLASSQLYVIKTGSDGQFEWERTYGPPDYLCDGYSIAAVHLGGFAMAGTAASFPEQRPGEFLIIRTNMAGNAMWYRKYGDPGYAGTPWSIEQTESGDFIVGGESIGDTFRNRRMILMRLTLGGRIKWVRHYDPNFSAGCCSARPTRDGGFIMGGYTVPADTYDPDACLIKTDADGNQQWKLVYGGSAGENIYSVQQTADGGYVGCGLTASSGHGYQDLLLLRVDSSGDVVWSRTYGGALGDYGLSVVVTSDGGFAMTGLETSWGPGRGIYAIKTDADGNVHMAKNATPAVRFSSERLTVSPNPFVSFAAVPGMERERFVVYDVLGRRIGQYPGGRIGSDLAPGVYMLRPSQGNDPPLRIVKVR